MENNIHKGHRQRLKDKVRQNGLNSLSAHEKLELLLTYTIPQKDTNALAHKLLNQYGYFANVLNADYNELLQIKGVGEETALFLSNLPAYFEFYKSSKADAEKNSPAIISKRDCVNYFASHFEIKSKEMMYIVMLNRMHKPIRTIEIEGESDCKIKLNIDEVSAQLNNKNTAEIVVYHTHPKGDVKPSDEDILATQNLFTICAVLRIQFNDHLIFNETNYFSFKDNHIVDNMRKNFNIGFANTKQNNTELVQKEYNWIVSNYTKRQNY